MLSSLCPLSLFFKFILLKLFCSLNVEPFLGSSPNFVPDRLGAAWVWQKVGSWKEVVDGLVK